MKRFSLLQNVHKVGTLRFLSVTGVSALLLVSACAWLLIGRQQVSHAAGAQPTLQALDTMTNNGFGTQDNQQYDPNGWGDFKSRVITTSTGDVFAVYTSAGTGVSDRQWHLMHQAPGQASWTEIKNGDAGDEVINIMRGPHDEIHLFGYPGTNLVLVHFVSTDLGKTFTQENVPGQWQDPNSAGQGYASTSIDPQGNMVVAMTGTDTDSRLYWAYYSAANKKWYPHTTIVDVNNSVHYRYTYNFIFLGKNNDFTFAGMRDILPNEFPSGESVQSGSDWIFNEINYFHIGNITGSSPSVKEVQVVHLPQLSSYPDGDNRDITYLSDAYVDLQGTMHIIYNNHNENSVHEALMQNDVVTKDVRLSLSTNGDSPNLTKVRITQDPAGHFYLTTIDSADTANTLYVYSATGSDTNGTQFNAATHLNISSRPGCQDYDFCNSPTLTVPRFGNPLSNTIDAVYGSSNYEYHARIQLTNVSTPIPTPTLIVTPTATLAPTPTSTITPTVTPTSTPTVTPTSTPTATPTSTSTSYRYSFEDGTTDNWGGDYITSLAASANFAKDGSHSLQIVDNGVTTDSYPEIYINNWDSNDPMPDIGKTITAWVYVPAGGPVAKETLFVEDSTGAQYYPAFSQLSNLTPGQWTQLSYVVPSSVSGGVVEYGLAFEFEDTSSSQNLTAYLDAVNW